MKLGHIELPSATCRAVGQVLARIGDKWSVLVIILLSHRSHRFNELRREIPVVSQKMLTTTLRGLERDGFVTRTVTPSIPPRVDYALTDLGRDVLVPLNAVAHWALEHQETVLAARAAYDARAEAA
ncbi:winged helix-turn-helix transcriptional regulator [Zavarzinia sp. CC-PAN008]|uniref:winged helix-turn-helix transcriptional regulator n=1 Tax=Zavarzinia sp. CC-PAN008 TaxID=3243332 RepID=UPI003F744AB7